MESIIKIPSSHSKQLVEYYKARIKVIEKTIKDTIEPFQKELDEIQAILKQIEKTTKKLNTTEQLSLPVEDKKINGFYNEKATWLDKAAFVIKEYNKPMSARDIVGCIINDHETTYNSKEGRKKVMLNISTGLSLNHGTGKRFTRSKKDGELIYDLNDK